MKEPSRCCGRLAVKPSFRARVRGGGGGTRGFTGCTLTRHLGTPGVNCPPPRVGVCVLAHVSLAVETQTRMKADICALKVIRTLFLHEIMNTCPAQTIIFVRVYERPISHRPPSYHKLIWHILFQYLCVCVHVL